MTTLTAMGGEEMPLAVESLNPQSNDADIQAAISLAYKQCMDEGGRTMEECGGMIYSIAREKTGKPLEYSA